MQAQSQKSQQFQQYKSLLSRSKSYTHLIFYNRKLINNYHLASYGFRLSLSRDGHEQAKCDSCGSSFQLDPIIQEGDMEIKDSYARVIADHQQGCAFQSRGQKYDKCVSFNRKTIGIYGAVLFWEIVQHNTKSQQITNSTMKAIDRFKSTLSKNQQNLLNKLSQNNKKLIPVYLLSLLGWKQHNQSLICEYCNETVTNFNEFSLTQSHRGCCLLVTDQQWEIILQKLTIDKLGTNAGQFVKTEGEAFAKNLRNQLEKMMDQSVTALREVKYKIKSIKNSIQTMDEEDTAERDQRARKFDKIGHTIGELEQYLKNSVKKIKID